MSIAKLLDIESLAFVYALAFVVVYGLLTSRINTKGLLLDKSGSGAVRPERIQFMIATMVIAGKYLADVFGTSNPAFPPIDSTWLYLLGGSSGVYVSRKLYERFGGSGHQG
jgi:hypothetical protein